MKDLVPGLILSTQHQQILDLTLDRVEVIDLNGLVRTANHVSEMFFAPAQEPLVGHRWLARWDQEERADAALAFTAALQGQTRNFTAPLAPAPGLESHCWATTLGPLRDDDGRIEAVVAISRDITERIRAEGVLKALNEVLRGDMRAANDLVVEERAHSDALQHKLERVAAAQGQVHDQDSDLPARPPQVSGEAVVGSHREQLLQDQLDLATTAQQIAEEVARQAQKSAAIGQLVAGIAHDFNNMLQVVQMTLDLMALQGDIEPRQQRLIVRSQEALAHATTLAARLLAFGRQSPYRAEPLELGQVVAGMAPLIEHGLGARMVLVVHAAETALHLRSDKSSIEQALMNLCVNARDACEGRGRIDISLGRLEVMPDQLDAMQSTGTYVYVEVRDDGCGMDEATQAKIFEPFFTTKPEGKGTGLGMAQVFGLMRRSEGFASVESSLGHGTRVRLVFPEIGVD